MKRIIALISLLIITMGGLYFFLPAQPIPHKKPSESAPIQLSIASPQETLLFLELINEKNTLHPDWYELINPIAYVVTNGLIKSVTGYLFLDLTQPLHTALVWEEDQSNPTILLSLPSQQGVQAAENLSRNLKPYGDTLQNGFQWHGNIELPRLPKSSLTWEGTKEQLLLAWRPFPSQQPFPLSSFVTSSKPSENILHAEIEKLIENTIVSTLTLNTTITSKTLRLNGSGTWNHTPTPQPSYPPELIAGWNIPGIPPVQIYKNQDSVLCFAGTKSIIQKKFKIQAQCPLQKSNGIFALFSEEFFAHIDVPLAHVELSAWGTAKMFTLKGYLQKKETRGLFPLYIKIHSLLMSEPH